MSDDPNYGALVDAHGVEWVARRYVEMLRDSLEQLRQSPGVEPDEPDPEHAWIEDVVWMGGWGDPLPPETRLALVIHAADAAVEDDSMLWCIGDGPADHLVGDSMEMIPRLHDARRTHPGVDRMFVVMLDYLRRFEHPLGWWADPRCART